MVAATEVEWILAGPLAARVEELHPQKKEDEEVKADPIAERSGARHLASMLQRAARGAYLGEGLLQLARCYGEFCAASSAVC